VSYNIKLDHTIVAVNDIKETVQFYSNILGCSSEGECGPFTTLRINEGLTFQLAPWGTEGGSHFAFVLPANEFNEIFKKIQLRDIAYGDSYNNVGEQSGPGREEGAKGMGKTIYFNDPNKHLLEIRTYEGL